MSLRIRLALIGTLLLAVSLGLVSFVTVRTLHGQFEAAQQARVLQLRPLLNAALAVPMVQRDYASVQAILEESLQDVSLRQIVAFDAAGRRIASAGQPSPSDRSGTPERLSEFKAGIELAGQNLGTVAFTLSRRDLDQALARVTREVLTVGAAVLLFFSAVLWVLTGTVTRRLQRLVDASRSIHEGRYDPKLPAPSNDEVGILVKAFAAMSTEIRRRVDELRLANAGLEQQVAERTRDLTDRTRELDRSVRSLQTKTFLLNRAPFAVLVLDAEAPGFPVLDTTDAIFEVFGHDPAAVAGRSVADLEPPDQRGVLAGQLRAVVQEGRTAEWEAEVLFGSGARRWARCLAFPVRDEACEPLRVALCLADVQELWQAREDQRRLAGEFQETSKLRLLNLAIAGIAHDLNTPIGIAVTASTKMRGILQPLVSELDAQPPPGPGEVAVPADRLRMLHRASDLAARNLEKAGALVASFKTTTANAAKVQWQRVSLSSLLEALLVTLSPITERARCTVRLTCPGDLSILTEPGSLGQVVTNLVVNATVHAFEGRTGRELRIEVERAGPQVLIRVADNGNGMSAEAGSRVFTPFFTTRRDSGGSGLGLFSSRRVVEDVLGGTISVRSVPGEGTTFEILLPVLDKPYSPAAAPGAAAATPRLGASA